MEKIIGSKNLRTLCMFTQRIVKLCNSMPQDVVDTKSVRGLKKWLCTEMDGKVCAGGRKQLWRAIKGNQDTVSGSANQSCWMEEAGKLCDGSSSI